MALINKNTPETGNAETFVDEKELKEAAKRAQNPVSVFSMEFKKPVVYNNKEYEKLEFDFDMLTGRDGLDIEYELTALGRPAVVPAFNGEYLIRIAARACTTAKIGSDMFTQMRLSDFNKIRSAARNFLLNSE